MENNGTVDPVDDAVLIARSLRGDKDAFGELVERYFSFATRIAYRMTGQPQIAEDLAQESFVKAWLKLSQYRGDSSFRTWLGRIVTNTTLDYLRRTRDEYVVDDELFVPTHAGIRPQPLLEGWDLQELVRHAILALPPESRAVVILREYEGLSYRDIAQALDIPMGTVMSRLYYARERLKTMLEPEIFEGAAADETEKQRENRASFDL